MDSMPDKPAVSHTTQRHWYQEGYVWLVIAIPGLAVVMGVVLITLASTSFDGLVADDYYKKGF